MKNAEEFGNWLARERYDAGITIRKLAERVGKHIDANIISYESGIAEPTLKTALKLTKALEHDLEIVSKDEQTLLLLYRKADETMQNNIKEILRVSNK